MKKSLLLALFVASAAMSQAAVVFYGGDYQGDPPNGGNNLADQHGGTVTDARVYDDFTLTQSTTITGLFSNVEDLLSVRATNAYYEIRSGVSSGNGGTLLASGTVAATAVATGRTEFGGPEFTYTGTISSLTLGAGTYWFTFAPDASNTSGQTYESTTIGTNGVGTPLNNGHAFFSDGNAADFGSTFNFAAVSDVLGTSYDFSQGVLGTAATPEPATWAVLGLGILAVIKRRRK